MTLCSNSVDEILSTVWKLGRQDFAQRPGKALLGHEGGRYAKTTPAGKRPFGARWIPFIAYGRRAAFSTPVPLPTVRDHESPRRTSGLEPLARPPGRTLRTSLHRA